ncbi:MAG: AzlD domain-containing protein, partial [Gammaproteobacteria bacterium]|nr:AzlD domain-containing protein [Gammaproteobacteria bacterium]
MTDQTVWIVIIGLGIGTFIIRYSFIGIIGDKELPEWL